MFNVTAAEKVLRMIGLIGIIRIIRNMFRQKRLLTNLVLDDSWLFFVTNNTV